MQTNALSSLIAGEHVWVYFSGKRPTNTYLVVLFCLFVWRLFFFSSLSPLCAIGNNNNNHNHHHRHHHNNQQNGCIFF